MTPQSQKLNGENVADAQTIWKSKEWSEYIRRWTGNKRRNWDWPPAHDPTIIFSRGIFPTYTDVADNGKPIWLFKVAFPTVGLE